MSDHLPVPVELTGRELDAVAAGQIQAANLVAVNLSDIDVTVSNLLQHIAVNVVANANVLGNAIQRAGGNAQA
jgi:hypothetical protein